MGSVDPVDDRTFKVNFSGDGAAKLREKVKDKLKEFMGDYTDDTLVEYVIVLLRNGRRKEEARNELNVFLGDDSHSFVSWLWDHLSANLDLYVQPQESHVVEAAKTKFTSGNQAGDNDSHQLDSESQGGKSSKLSQNQPNREGEGLARDAADGPPLSRSEVDNMHFEEKTDRKVRRERSSPQTSFQKKRSRIDERELSKEATVDAPRRLLQFAVRDALGTSKPSVSSKEPSLKRLRSVVSTSTGDSLSMDRPRRIRSVARVPNAMATVIKAVAEAAEDVRKVKSAGGSVFDRLSRGTDVPDTLDQLTEIREAAGGDEEYIDLSKSLQQTQPVNRRRSDYSGQYVGNVAVLENESALDSMSDNEGYDTVSVIGHRGADVRWTNSSGVNKNEDLMMVQYSLANNVDDVRRRAWNEGQNKANAATTASRKVANNPVNVNAWKPPNYQELREVADYDCQKSVQQSEAGADKSTVRSMKENNNPVTVGNGNGKPAADIQRESPKMMSNAGASTAGRPLEDADSRTVFVSNVHFAATKDALSRHFNKFGEVLKVVILTDAATGQPKGSAYVEFMRKEAADDALALDGTSFMSRMLKVVRRSSAQQEAMPIMTWPHNRGSPYTAARFQFQRGITGGFRPHYSVKTGPRSLQWTREKQATSAESGVSGPGTSALVCTRSRTYVRTVSKSDGKSGT